MTAAPKLQRVGDMEALSALRFEDGIAAVEMPWTLARRIRFKNSQRSGGPRLDRLAAAIRRDGFQPFDPIIVRIGRKGRWIVVDGGHRLTAAARVDREWWPNLYRRKVNTLYFLVFTTHRSWSALASVKRKRRRGRRKHPARP